MKVLFPRRFNPWLVAIVSLAIVALVAIAPAPRSRAQGPTTYTFTDLGTLGGTASRAFSINNCGQIVGESSVSGASPVHPFIFRDANNNGVADSGEMKDLGTLGGSSGSATDINATGMVCGTSTILAGEPHAFRWQDSNSNGQPDAGELKDLGSPAGQDYFAFGVNNSHQIVGGGENNLIPVAFIWSPATGLQNLPDPSPSPKPNVGYAINNSGQVVGHAANNQAFFFNGTTYTYMGTFGGNRSIAYSVNDSGHAAGFAWVNDLGANPPQRAFKWNGSTLQDLGVLTGGTRSTAWGINSAGTVVGSSEVTGGDLRAFIHDGTLRDLNGAGVVTNLPVNWLLKEAKGINDSGQIVGYGTTPTGDVHAFLLTPTGLPASTCPAALPIVDVSVSPSSVNEEGGGPLTFTFTRSVTTASSLGVSFAATGTASAGDYGILPSFVTIPANQASATVIVTPTADLTDEPNETVILTVTPDANYVVGTAATGTINDNDNAPQIQINDVTAPEPASGSTPFFFTVSLTNPSSSQITVNYATAAGTATAGTSNCGGGVDYFSASGGLTFAAGETSKQVAVTVCSDSDLENDETFFVNLSGNSSNSTLPDSQGVGTITPQTPFIFTKENNGTVAAAVDSVTFAEGPFRVFNGLNFSADQTTRIIIFTTPLGMTNANLASGILSVRFNGTAVPLANIEHVGPVASTAGSFIIVKLPSLPNGSNNLTVRMGSAESNTTTISIIP